MAASSTLFPDPNFFLPYYLNDNNNLNNDNNYLITSQTQLYNNYSHNYNYNYNYSDMANLDSTPLASSSNPDDTNKMVRKRPASEMDQPSSNPTPNRFLNRQNNDLLYTNQVVNHNNNNNELPLVCGFSGLPLFPPVITRDKFRHNNINNNNQLMVNSSNNSSLDDPSWVDGIIKDLIQSSNSISIPQLIQNVRDIIYPCNPNLGAVIEYRLRSLAEPIQVNPTLAALPTIHQQQQQQEQEQMISAVGLQNKVYFGSGDHGPNVTSPVVVVVEDSTSIRKPPNNTTTPVVDNTATAASASASAATTSPLPQQPSTSTPPASASASASASAAVLKAREKETVLQRKRDEEGLHLLTLLLQCAEAVSSDNSEDANKMLVQISEWATPFGTSAQRVAAYFSLAMSARLITTRLGIHSSLPVVPHYSKLVSAFQVFNGISPFVKFSHFTANQAIQEAFQREDRVHIIDLDIMQGLQWPGLFHILASRPGGPPFVRLTGLGTSFEALEATGKRLTDFAHKLGLPFEYIAVADKIGNLDLEKLHISKREAVAVHWLQHSLYDVTGSDTNTLCLLQR